MDALEGLLRIHVSKPPEELWQPERFRQVALEGKRRWQEIEELFDIEYPMFADAVSIISPSFRLSQEEESTVRSADVSCIRTTGTQVAVAFLRWERCSETAGLPNPYEPWIEIWEHGGAFSVEHGQFVDIYDSRHMPMGGFVVRRA